MAAAELQAREIVLDTDLFNPAAFATAWYASFIPRI